LRPVSGSGDTNSDIARIKSTVQAEKAGSGAFSHDKAGVAGKAASAGRAGAAGKTMGPGGAKATAGGELVESGQTVAGKAAGTAPGKAPVGEAAKAAAGLVGKSAAAGLPAGIGSGSAASAAAVPASTAAGGRLADFLVSLHIRPDSSALAAAQALMAEAVSLSRVHILQLRSFMRRFPGQEQVAAGVAARALASGVNLDDPLVEGLAGFFSKDDGATDQRQGSNSGQRQNPDRRYQPEEDGGQAADENRQISAAKQAQSDALPGAASKTSPGFPGPGPALPESVSRLTETLQALAAGLLSDQGMRKLHRPGPDGRAWLHIPLNFQQDSIEFHVMLRILYNYHSKSSEKMVLALEQHEALWMFDLDASNSTCRLLGGEAEPKIPEKLLRAALQRYGVALLLPQTAEAVQSSTVLQVDQHV